VAYHLLTVDHCHRTGFGLQVAPTVRFARLVSEFPDGEPALGKGCGLELRLPGGRVMAADVGGWGIDAYRDGDHVVISCSPADPEFTLSISVPEDVDVPPGTEVWLPDVTAASCRPEPGPCSYCQAMQWRAGGAEVREMPRGGAYAALSEWFGVRRDR
jgi:hypothetical protein